MQIDKLKKRTDGSYVVNGIYHCKDENDAVWLEIAMYERAIKLEESYELPDDVTQLQEKLWFKFFVRHDEEPTREQTAEAWRLIRNDELKKTVDKYTAVQFSALPEVEQIAIKEYRQAWLDVPQQAGFPDTVILPKSLKGK